MREFGFYWITRSEYDGLLHTVAKYRPAYSWDKDQRNCWDIPGSDCALYDTVEPNASNRIIVGKYLGTSEK